ncbi:MAG: hypothetical protein WC444_06955 [Candidatus Paceibacterota bacterium]
MLASNKCALGLELPKYNPDQLCPVPILQAKSRVYGIEIFDENILLKRLQDIFNVMRQWAEDPQDCKYMMDCLMKIKEEYYPSVKKNLNINMDIQVKDQFEKFYDKVINDETKNPNKTQRQDAPECQPDSERQGRTEQQEQN